MRNLIATTFALALITGCEALDDNIPDWGIEDDTAWDTGDWEAREATSGPPILEEVNWSCNPGTGQWTYTARTSGWAALISLDIHETGSSVPWTEYHELRETAWDEQGTWDEWGATLSKVNEVDHVFPGRTTLYECGYHADDSLTWLYATYDGNGETVSCVSTGHRPSYWTNDMGFYGCESW